MAVKALQHCYALRAKIRQVVLLMGASKDADSVEEEDDSGLGAADRLDDMRWQRCIEIGRPLQEAWGYAVAERLFNTWRRLKLDSNGVPVPLWSGEMMSRTGLPDVNATAWCPPKPIAPARCPSRTELREYLGLLMGQKRIHCDELVRGYQHFADLASLTAPTASAFTYLEESIRPASDAPLLKKTPCSPCVR